MKKGIILLLCLTLLFGITVLPVSAEELLVALPPVMSYRPGDLDGDGSISTADARLCLRAAVGLQQLPDGEWQGNAAASLLRAATANTEDQTFTTATARKILRSAIGLDNLNTATAVIKTDQPYYLKGLTSAGSGAIYWTEPEVSDENLQVSISTYSAGEGNPGDPAIYHYLFSSDVPGEYQVTFKRRNVQISQTAVVDSFTVHIIVEE